MRGILPVASIPDPLESAVDTPNSQANPCGEIERETPVDRPRIERAIREILLAVGENPDREGLQDTPRRVARMYAELFGGLHQDPRRHLRKFFSETCDEVVLVRDISFNSMCEHHLLPFMGTAHVAYLPGERVIGLSKLARVVEEVARQPQVQERMTEQIANLLVEELHAKGVARGDRGGAYVYDDPRHSQARFGLRHLGHEGLFPHEALDPCGTDDADLRQSTINPKQARRMSLLDQQRERIQDDLRGLIAGEVRCDDVFLQLFASDASIYEIKPLGVVRPRSVADVSACGAMRPKNVFRSMPGALALAWRANRSGRDCNWTFRPTCAARCFSKPSRYACSREWCMSA